VKLQLSTTHAYRGRVIDVDVDEVRLPNGHHATLEVIRHPGGAAIVALNARNEVCLLRQYRYAVSGWLWEVPAGKRDGGEPAERTAVRELAEEAGCTAGRWDSLGSFIASPGVFTEQVHLFLARDLETFGNAPEKVEVFEIAWLPLEEACERALRGEITDGKSVVALLRARHLLGHSST
jgi:ADP-ribose pyrophosphatase